MDKDVEIYIKSKFKTLRIVFFHTEMHSCKEVPFSSEPDIEFSHELTFEEKESFVIK